MAQALNYPNPRDWTSYVASMPPPALGAAGWAELTEVTHGTHAREALRIVEDGWIYPELVQEGPLAATRTSVCFFSPYPWRKSRYGVVNLKAEWRSLVGPKTRLYWLETDTVYEVPQFRMLVTDRDVSGLPVRLYDPTADCGPVRKIEEAWLWASRYAAEFLVPDAVSLLDISELEFKLHGQGLCPQNRLYCPEYEDQGLIAGRRQFMAGLLGNPPCEFNEMLRTGRDVSPSVRQALDNVLNALGARRPDNFVGDVEEPDRVEALIRGALLLLSTRSAYASEADVRRITSCIARQDLLLHGFNAYVRSHLKAPDYDCGVE